MKALSIMQPFASLIVLGHKHFETRSRPTNYRGLLAIHASQRRNHHCRAVFEHELVQPLLQSAGFHRLENMPTGVILGVAELTDCIAHELFTHRDDELRIFNLSDLEFAVGTWGPRRWAWRLFQPVAWRTPVPVAGKLGLWSVPEEALQSVVQPGPVRW